MEIPSNVVLWTLGGLAGNLKSTNHYENNKGYHLKCKTNNKYLIWEKGQVSVNLDFDAAPQTKVHFHLPDGKEREILSGEPVAFAIGMGEAYLHYGSQPFGINLKWSTAPVHEWRVFGANGKKGQPIPTGAPCALVNDKVEPDADFLVFMEKHAPKVADLGWTTSPDWLKNLANKAATGVVKAIMA
ncbi:MAG: hypothetical protein JWO31_3884 [Phycisphaerales bacterium]|nr:hypothetical protein [Phycisphaerales bacterium]